MVRAAGAVYVAVLTLVGRGIAYADYLDVESELLPGERMIPIDGHVVVADLRYPKGDELPVGLLSRELDARLEGRILREGFPWDLELPVWIVLSIAICGLDDRTKPAAGCFALHFFLETGDDVARAV